MSDIIALDVSKGNSYCVVYHHNECIAEFDCLHNKMGFKKLKEAIDDATMPTVYFEATGVYLSRVIVKCHKGCQGPYNYVIKGMQIFFRT